MPASSSAAPRGGGGLRGIESAGSPPERQRPAGRPARPACDVTQRQGRSGRSNGAKCASRSGSMTPATHTGGELQQTGDRPQIKIMTYSGPNALVFRFLQSRDRLLVPTLKAVPRLWVCYRQMSRHHCARQHTHTHTHTDTHTRARARAPSH